MPKAGDKKAVVIRDNRLVRSSYWLTPPEKRFLYWLFWSYQQNGQREQTISIAELAKYCEVEGGSIYRTMYDVALRLQSRVVVIWDVEEDAPSFVNFTDKITPNWGKGTMKAVIDHHIEPLLKELHENFTITALETAVRLSSFYSMRLYDLAMCHKYRREGMLYSVEEIKAELGVLDLRRKSKTEVEIREDRYPVWKRFKEKVLDRAVAEVNEKTDVEVTIEAVKTGKTVTHVRLTARVNKRGAAMTGLSEKQGDQASLLLAVGMTAAEARKVVDAYGATDPDRITWHLANCKDKKSPLAWLRSGLKTDYRPQLRMTFEEKAKERDADRAERQRDEDRRAAGAKRGGGTKAIAAVLESVQQKVAAASVEKTVDPDERKRVADKMAAFLAEMKNKQTQQ